MGVLTQGIFGGFKGKVGNVVGSSWKGIPTIKLKPQSVANPKSSGQVAQRGAMTSIVEAARILLAALIQVYWNPFAQRMSGYNDFVKTNIKAFTTAGFTAPTSFFSMRGSLLGVTGATAVASASGDTITIDWTDNSGQADALTTDDAVAVIYNATQGYWIVDAGNAQREDEQLVVADTKVAGSDSLYVYVSFARPDASKVSDSTYIAVTAS